MRLWFTIACLALTTAASGELVDRIAVAVGNRAVRESQIDADVRVTEFLNGTPLDSSAAARRASASRLIDQALIRAEMTKGSYAKPSEAQVNDVLAGIKKARFHNEADYQASLKKYGITETELKSHVSWQIQVLQFADLRFGPRVIMRSAKDAPRNVIEERVNADFFAWLDASRARSRIEYHDEALR